MSCRLREVEGAAELKTLRLRVMDLESQTQVRASSEISIAMYHTLCPGGGQPAGPAGGGGDKSDRTAGTGAVLYNQFSGVKNGGSKPWDCLYYL